MMVVRAGYINSFGHFRLKTAVDVKRTQPELNPREAWIRTFSRDKTIFVFGLSIGSGNTSWALDFSFPEPVVSLDQMIVSKCYGGY